MDTPNFDTNGLFSGMSLKTTVTLKADADCVVLCDGQKLCRLKGNHPTQANVVEGTHLFTFIHSRNKKAIVERQVKCTTGDNNIICITGLAAANKLHPSIFVKILNKIHIPQVKNKSSLNQLIRKISALSLIVAVLLLILSLIFGMCNNPQSQAFSDDDSLASIENKNNVQDKNASSPKTSEKSVILERRGDYVSLVSRDGIVVSLGEGATFKFLSLEVSQKTATGENGEKGINIRISFESKNMSSTYLYCMVCIYDANGYPVKCHTNDSKYQTKGGNVYTGDWCIPETDNQTSKLTFFLPYSELPQTKGQTKYILNASFLRYSSSTEHDVIYESKSLSFNYLVN